MMAAIGGTATMAIRKLGNLSVDEGPALPDPEELLGSADRLTAQALRMMVARPVQPQEIAEHVGEPVEKVRKRLSELRAAGLIVAVETENVGGDREPFYRGPYVPLLDKEEWGELTPEERRAHLVMIIRLLTADLERAMEAETLDAWPDFHLCRIPFRVDRQGLRELRQTFDHAFLEAMRIKEEALKRLREGEERGVPGTAGLVMFESPEVE
jgi:hypothetical protein